MDSVAIGNTDADDRNSDDAVDGDAVDGDAVDGDDDACVIVVGIAVVIVGEGSNEAARPE